MPSEFTEAVVEAAAADQGAECAQYLLDPKLSASNRQHKHLEKQVWTFYHKTPQALTLDIAKAVAGGTAHQKKALSAVLISEEFPIRRVVQILHGLLVDQSPNQSHRDTFLVALAEQDRAIGATVLALLHSNRPKIQVSRWKMLLCDLLAKGAPFSAESRLDVCMQLFDGCDGSVKVSKILRAVVKIATTPGVSAAQLTETIKVLGQKMQDAAASSDPHGHETKHRSNKPPSKQTTSAIVRAIVGILAGNAPCDVPADARHVRKLLVQEKIIPQALVLVENHMARNSVSLIGDLLSSPWAHGSSMFCLVSYVANNTAKRHNGHVQAVRAQVSDAVFYHFSQDIKSLAVNITQFVREALQQVSCSDEAVYALLQTFTNHCIDALATPSELDAAMSQLLLGSRTIENTVSMLVVLQLQSHGVAEHGLHDSVGKWALQNFAEAGSSLDDIRLSTWSARILLLTGVQTLVSADERQKLKRQCSDTIALAGAESPTLLRFASRILCQTRQESHAFFYHTVTMANRNLFRAVHRCKEPTMPSGDCERFIGLQAAVVKVTAEDISADVRQSLNVEGGLVKDLGSARPNSENEASSSDYMHKAKVVAEAKKLEDRIQAAFVESNFLSSYVGMLQHGLKMSPGQGTNLSLPAHVQVSLLSALAQFGMSSAAQAQKLLAYTMQMNIPGLCREPQVELYAVAVQLLARVPYLCCWFFAPVSTRCWS
eukprot:INCI7259.11.p1 GENE.INCI7259.11~~INCI7259.11.p1  ORF type:complete len:715 (-),score=113.01 INCI7259.11:975-3119(-)